MSTPPLFSGAERETILIFARAVMGAELTGGVAPEVPEIPLLHEKGSCFVSLFINGRLKSSMGNSEAFETLGENIRRNALNAAFNDPFSPPLTGDELKIAEIELSIPNGFEPFTAEKFIPGETGLLLTLEGRRAVFLPRVIRDEGWEMETALEFLARKAGSDSGDWNDPRASISIFKTETFR